MKTKQLLRELIAIRDTIYTFPSTAFGDMNRLIERLNKEAQGKHVVRVVAKGGKIKEAGVVIGERACQLTGCRGTRLIVRWPSGLISHPCTKGMDFDESKRLWRIH